MNQAIETTFPIPSIGTDALAVCERCVMDSTVPEIRFDSSGECQYCRIHDYLEQRYPLSEGKRQENLGRLVDLIRRSGKGKSYDVICGISGGRDSCYALYNAIKVGLRPLAVHFDNGWNSTTSVTNIQNVTRKLNVDLETVVADWNEFRALQVSFLEASVPDVEVPTDVAIHGVLHRIAAREGIKTIFFGHSFRTEGISPMGWSYIDGRYIEKIHETFGQNRLRDFPNFKLSDFILYSLIHRIRVIPFLSYFPYDQAHVTELLSRELGWAYYGGHHHESLYTRFIQSYLLPKKFNIDKRKTEYSALIRSGQMDRANALQTIRSTPYQYDESLIPYVITKLELTMDRWERIFRLPIRSFKDYPSYYGLMRGLKVPIKIAAELKLLPELIYLKYLG